MVHERSQNFSMRVEPSVSARPARGFSHWSLNEDAGSNVPGVYVGSLLTGGGGGVTTAGGVGALPPPPPQAANIVQLKADAIRSLIECVIDLPYSHAPQRSLNDGQGPAQGQALQL